MLSKSQWRYHHLFLSWLSPRKVTLTLLADFTVFSNLTPAWSTMMTMQWQCVIPWHNPPGPPWSPRHLTLVPLMPLMPLMLLLTEPGDTVSVLGWWCADCGGQGSTDNQLAAPWPSLAVSASSAHTSSTGQPRHTHQPHQPARPHLLKGTGEEVYLR